MRVRINMLAKKRSKRPWRTISMSVNRWRQRNLSLGNVITLMNIRWLIVGVGREGFETVVDARRA